MKVILSGASVGKGKWWVEPELNRRHKDFQSSALPTELSSHFSDFAFARKREGETNRTPGDCKQKRSAIAKNIRHSFFGRASAFRRFLWAFRLDSGSCSSQHSRTQHMKKHLSIFFAVLFLGFSAGVNAADTANQTGKSGSADPHFQIPASDEGLPGAGPIRRYEWFQKTWRDRRSKWARDAAKDHGAVVFLGDSITQGWHDNMDGSFPGMKVANRGISGDTTRGVLIRLQEDVI